MALPGQPQTFALGGCRDMLDKLQWEIGQLRQDRTDPARVSYSAFNAAVTAWHIGDWVWEDMTAETKHRLGYSKQVDLQDASRKACRAIYLCRQVATASKHSKVTSYRDPHVDASISAGPSFPMRDEAGNEIVHVAWTAKIIDEGQRIDAAQVFEEALNYWTRFIHENSIGNPPDLEVESYLNRRQQEKE